MSTNPVDRLPDFMQADAEAKVNRLREACREAGVALPDDPEFHHQLAAVLAFSDFVAERCTRRPRLLTDLTDSGDLQHASGAGEYAARLARALEGVAEVTDLGLRLRRFRGREMVRIAWRDLAGLADLAETTADLSALAEACLDHALAWLYRWQSAAQGVPTGADGRPQALVVLGLGKLGAGELNFSSDVDLIFAYPGPGETSGTDRPVANDDFFTRLARQLIQVIGHPTADGFVFRVDLRLRPFGDNGPWS